MKKGILMTAAIGMLSTGMVLGQTDMSTTTSTTTSYSHSAPGALYRGQEFSIDLFGGGTLDEHDIDHLTGRRIRNDGRLGWGAGGNFFFCRYLGVGGEFYTENPDAHFVDETSGSLILRLPIGETGLAPYAFVGGGHRFDP